MVRELCALPIAGVTAPAGVAAPAAEAALEGSWRLKAGRACCCCCWNLLAGCGTRGSEACRGRGTAAVAGRGWPAGTKGPALLPRPNCFCCVPELLTLRSRTPDALPPPAYAAATEAAPAAL